MALASMTTSSKADDRGRGRPLEAAQHSLHPGHQLPGSKGFGDVVVRTQLQAENAVIFARPGGEKDDRYGAQSGVAAQPAAYVQAVSSGHHDVQQKEHGRLALSVRHEVGRSAVDADPKTGGFQMMLYQAGNIRIIFQDAYGLTQMVLPDVQAARDTATLSGSRSTLRGCV